MRRSSWVRYVPFGNSGWPSTPLWYFSWPSDGSPPPPRFPPDGTDPDLPSSRVQRAKLFKWMVGVVDGRLRDATRPAAFPLRFPSGYLPPMYPFGLTSFHVVSSPDRAFGSSSGHWGHFYIISCAPFYFVSARSITVLLFILSLFSFTLHLTLSR